ncbi:Nitroreductase-like protein [Aspergillus karnatakaensis]|uniref:Nitroreductase-like protein n=1 Tax=Aspergillus karnatakaensis TaxID=1810916 RepID=UPI003CCC958E
MSVTATATSLASAQTLLTILTHESCRSFLPTPLPPSTLPTLTAAAQSASTSSLLQTYDIIAVQDPQRKSLLASLSESQPFINQAPLLLIFCPSLRRLENLSTLYNTQPKALDTMEMFITCTVDAAIAGQNVVFAAESLGLGACYVGAIRNDMERVCEVLGLPRLTYPVFGIAVGYPERLSGSDSGAGSGNGIKPRLPMGEILHDEVWSEDLERQRGNIEAYDAVLGEFYLGQRKGGRDGWGRSARRWAFL